MLYYSSLKKTVFIITITALLFSTISSAETASPDCQIPVVTGANNWFPYSYIDDKNIQKGIGFDVVELIFADLNIPIKYRFGLPWIRAMKEVNQGSIDVLVANYWTEERAKKLVMSTEIARESLNVFTLKTKPFIFNKWDDLKKQRGAMPRGMALGEAFKKYSQNIDLIEVNTHQQIFKMLNKERVDYVLLAQYSAQPNLLQKENENVVMQSTPVNYYSVHISFSKNSSCLYLFDQFEQALAERINDGSVAKIISTYVSN